jgi:hypothetical protein
MMLRKTLDRLRKRRQGIGSVMLLMYGFVWLVRKLSAGAVHIHYRYILLQQVPAEPLLKRRFDGAIQVRRLEGTELLSEFDRDRDGAFTRPAVDRDWIKRRVEQGDICIAAVRSSRTIGVLWLSFSTFDETEVRAIFVVNAKAGMAWDSNLFIVEDSRAGPVFLLLWEGANQLLREKGYRWSATQTAAFNGASLQAHKRLGAYRIGRIVYVSAGPMQVTFSSLRPHFHLAGPSGNEPVFVIPAPNQSSTSRQLG